MNYYEKRGKNDERIHLLQKKYNPEFNNINITMLDGNVREFLEFTKKEICAEMKVMVRGLYNKNVREYGCEINSKKN